MLGRAYQYHYHSRSLQYVNLQPYLYCVIIGSVCYRSQCNDSSNATSPRCRCSGFQQSDRYSCLRPYPSNNTNCNESAYVDCVKDGLDCIDHIKERSDICECNQQASACLIDAGCGPGYPSWDKFYDACVNNDGCTAAQCSSASSFAIIFGLVIAVTHTLWLL